MIRRNLFKAIAGALASLPVLKALEVRAAPEPFGIVEAETAFAHSYAVPASHDNVSAWCWGPNYLTSAGVCIVNPETDLWERDQWYWNQARLESINDIMRYEL